MSTNVTLPALGESVTQGTVSRWLKEVGDTVEADEAIVEVSTDKVDTEVPAPVAGVILEICFAEESSAPVGSVLCVIGDPSEANASAPAPVVAAPVAPIASPAPVAAPAAPAAQVATATTGTEIVLPALGESVTQGTVSRWLKEVGETIEADEPIVEVSTDKVDTEVASPVAGTLLEIRFAEDSVAPVGAVLAIVGNSAAPVASTVAAADKTEEPKRGGETTATPAEPVVARRAEAGAEDDLYVTPLVRKLATENGIDLTTLVGTGVGGRIRKQDVLAAAGKGEATTIAPVTTPVAPVAAPAPVAPPVVATPAPVAATPAVPAAPAPVSAPAAPAAPAIVGKTEKMSRLRQTIASRMVESLHTAAQLTATVEVDLTKITRIRSQVKGDFKAKNGVGLSYLPFITKAAIEQLQAMPQFNATINPDNTVTYHDVVNMGIAVDTPKGLFVPVVKDAADLTVTGLAKKIADVAGRTRDNQITPDELAGGTFTITNYGSAGALMDTPIINIPQVAILGTGGLVRRPVVVDDGFGEQIAIRDMMFLSMTYDHRLIDGAVAARFLKAVKTRLEEAQFGEEFGV